MTIYDTFYVKNSLYEFGSALFVQMMHYFGFTIQLVYADVGDFIQLQYRTILGDFVPPITLYREVYTGVKYVLMWSLKEIIG